MMIDWDRYQEIDALRESGHPAEALPQYKTLRDGCTDAADRSSILLGESLAYRDLGRLDEAGGAASEAVRLLPEDNPSRPYAEFCLACVYEGKEKFDEAAEQFRAILKKHADLLNENEYVWLRRDAKLRLVSNLIMLERAIEPLSLIEGLKSEDLSPEDRAALLFREAIANGFLGRSERALELYQEALSGALPSPMKTEAYIRKGAILFEQAEYRRALTEFECAAQLAGSENADSDVIARWIRNTTRALGE